jgi:TolB-like protein
VLRHGFLSSLGKALLYTGALGTLVSLPTGVLLSQTSGGYDQQIQSTSTRLAGIIARSGRKNIAVVDFTDLKGNVTELGRFLAEEFSVALEQDASGFAVIDRTQLKAILQEHRLSAKGLIDPETARKVGMIAGADALVTGTITPFSDSVRLTVKVLDTQSAVMVGATAVDIPRTKTIDDLLAKSISPTEQPSGNPITLVGGQGSSAHQNRAATFETDSYKVTVDSFRKTIASAKLTLTFENLTSKDLPLGLRYGGIYLLDENGNKWNFKESNQAWIGMGTANLPPLTKLRGILTFSPAGQDTGTRFTFIAEVWSPSSGEIIIRDVR